MTRSGSNLTPAPRLAGWHIVLTAVVVQLGLSVLANQVLFPSGLLDPIATATGGLVAPTLSANVIMLVVNVVGVIMILGGLRARDLGLRPGRRAVGVAIAVAVAAWVAGQVWIAIASGASGESPGLSPGWAAGSAGRTAGKLLAQVFGNALYEETLFRGFLLVQVAWLLTRPVSRSARRAAPGARTWLAAIVLSQGLFALSHVPNRLMRGAYESLDAFLLDQGMLLAAGTAFGVIFLGTRNLWICVLLHALANEPTPLLAGGDGGAAAQALAMVLALIVSIGMLVRRGMTRAADAAA